MQSATENRPEAAAARGSPRSRAAALKKLVAYRRLAKPVLLLVPTLMVLTVDLSRRGPRVLEFTGFYWETYLAALVESLPEAA